MCGICGVVDFSRAPGQDAVERMMRIIRHRGPDEAGLQMLGAAALGFRRLSIIDLAGSHQPMSNENGTVWVVFNGEIYNFKELRQELATRGHRFATSGDTETIVHLYEDHGLDFVDHLNGMFAIAVWDANRQRLVLARDRLGIKPLYYAVHGDQVYFASETKAILLGSEHSYNLDMDAVRAWFNFMSVPDKQTCFSGIRRLSPGHIAVLGRSGFSEQQYWDVDFSRQRDWKDGDLQEAVEALLRDSVQRQMIGDVPLGAFLSGGVDSSLVAAMMAEFSSRPVEMFSIGYNKEGNYLNELEYARAVADRYGMKHNILILDSNDLVRELDRVVWHLDELNGDPSAFLTLALSQFARQHVTVTLSGVGGDELFGGYRRHMAMKLQGLYRQIPAGIRNGLVRPLVSLLPESRTSRLTNYARLIKRFFNTANAEPRSAWAAMTSFLPGYEGPIFTGDATSRTAETYTCEAFERHWMYAQELPDLVDRGLYMDHKMYLADQLLLLQDKMSMAVSLEARVPFLDHRLVELAATVPASSKIRGRMLKVVLKCLAEKYIPRRCIYREKKGFGAPLEIWLQGPLREQICDVLTARRVRERGVFNVEFVEWLKRGFFGEHRELGYQLYHVFLFETWMRLFVDDLRRSAEQFPAGSPAALPGITKSPACRS